MKVFLKEFLYSLVYPLLLGLSMGACGLAGSSPNADGTFPFSTFGSWVLTACVIVGLIGVLVYSVLDWDRYFDIGIWRRLLLIASRVVSVILFFYPFMMLWAVLLSHLL